MSFSFGKKNPAMNLHSSQAGKDSNQAAPRSWDSPEGRREVVEEVNVHGNPRLRVRTEGQALDQFIPPDELEGEIGRDTKNLSLRGAARAQEAERNAREAAAKAKREDMDGYAADKSPMHRGKILESLNLNVKNNFRVISRKDLIREKVAEGATIKSYGTIGLVLEDPAGSYLDEKALSKTGIAYSAYLIEKWFQVRGEAAEQAAEATKAKVSEPLANVTRPSRRRRRILRVWYFMYRSSK